MKQFEMCELVFKGPVMTRNYASVDLTAEISCGEDKVSVKGFYAGDGTYKVRFLPRRAGIYTYQVTGCITSSGTVEVLPGEGHGMVVVKEQHFAYEDGTVYHPFGTTVYALAHQKDELVEETMETLSKAPFNKIRLCLFPKHYDFNHNEPKYYAFEKNEDGSWDVSRPCLAFWDDFEAKMCRLGAMGIQVDLILFHPYDRWGFAKLSQEENLIYLDYLLRRFAAYPFFWWSLANEYELCYPYKTVEDFEEIEQFVAEHDPYHHLLSNHNCFAAWDFSRPAITHTSYQIKMMHHVSDWYRQFQKPVMVDECCYEGNLPNLWGCITGEEMVHRFWTTVVSGGYCTHGETFLDTENEVIWWAKGGRLIGESPKRIAFLKDFVYSLPGYIEPADTQDPIQQLLQATPQEIEQMAAQIPEEFSSFPQAIARMSTIEHENLTGGEYIARGQVKDGVYLFYLGNFCPVQYLIDLPADRTYRVEVIDTWEMTRTTVLNGVSGNHVMVPMPGKIHMAIAAFAEKL